MRGCSIFCGTAECRSPGKRVAFLENIRVNFIMSQPDCLSNKKKNNCTKLKKKYDYGKETLRIKPFASRTSHQIKSEPDRNDKIWIQRWGGQSSALHQSVVFFPLFYVKASNAAWQTEGCADVDSGWCSQMGAHTNRVVKPSGTEGAGSSACPPAGPPPRRRKKKNHLLFLETGSCQTEIRFLDSNCCDIICWVSEPEREGTKLHRVPG